MEPIKTWRVHEEEKGRVEERLAGALAGEPDVVFAYLHGSFVEGEVFRDIDVAVFLDPFPTPAWPREAELAARLEATLRRAGLPFRWTCGP
jgi:predicted nucleotidyltransferase